MRKGVSWSGHERNSCFLNLGDATFADASFVSGLDFEDDGRSATAVDWDADGDLDLWIRNRTGPQLRYMQNDSIQAGHFVSFELQGTKSNRDAIGAVIVVEAGGREYRRRIRSADGYLAQPSRRAHFGIGEADAVGSVTVLWPGGDAERFEAPAIDGRYRLRQGSGRTVAVPRRSVALEAVPEKTGLPKTNRIVLRMPLPVPPTLGSVLPQRDPGAPRATLVNLWAHWCEPCLEELGSFAEAYEKIAATGIDVVALSADVEEDQPRAAELFAAKIATTMDGASFASRPIDDDLRGVLDALLGHVLERHDELTLPTSLLIDAKGMLQMVYLGKIDSETLIADAKRLALTQMQASRRSIYPGRWYFRTPRNLGGLAADLRDRGLKDDARYYYALQQFRQRGPQP